MSGANHWESPGVPVWPFVLVVAFFGVFIGGGALFMRRRLLAELREWMTRTLGEPRAVRELEPEDIFTPSPRAERLWKEVGLVVDGQLPVIRSSDRFNTLAWEIRQPRLSPRRLRHAVERLVARVDSPDWRTSPELMDVDSGSIHIGFVPA
ncbi:hypothetical protein ES705_35786 [subsurface metagenome]